MNKKAIRIIVVGGIALLITCTALYLLIWRPSDSEYTKVSSAISKTNDTSSKISEGLKSIAYASLIDETTPESLNTLIKSYSDAVHDLNGAMSSMKDQTVKQTYEKFKPNLDSYDTYLSDLSKSIEIYVKIITTCDSMQEKLATSGTSIGFDELAKDCTESISQVKSLDAKIAFKTDFLDNYTEGSSALLAAYRSISVASSPALLKTAQTDASKAIREITESGSKQLAYSPPDISSSLKSIQTTIDSQKGKLLR